MRCGLFVALMLAHLAGCGTPATYRAAALPRYLTDEPSEAAPLPAVPIAIATPQSAKPDLTLPDVVRECVLNNFRLKVGAERVKQIEGDYLTESLIPNCQLTTDAQLIPVTVVNFDNQAGPPQFDALLTVPIDWWLFGKRVAARAAARLNVDVAEADFADQLRREVARSVDTFYDALEADEFVKLAEEDLKALQGLELDAIERGKKDPKAAVEEKRVKLAVLDAQRELRRRRAAAETSKAKLQSLIGRPTDTPDFNVKGTLSVKQAAPGITVTQAWELALQHRPDLRAAERTVAAAAAAVTRERSRGRPQLSISTGPNYQYQQRITGFRNALLWTVAVNSTLPFTDRNQGRIYTAEAAARGSVANLGAITADGRAEVEQAVAEYTEALNGITKDDVDSLRIAREVRVTILKSYRTGERDLLDALDAERAYRDRVRSTLGNLTDYWQALNRLNAAVGLRILTAQESETESILEEATRPDK